MKRIVVLICCCLLALPVSSRAQEVPEGWEFISWGQWNKTRHYVGSLYNFNSWLQLETYYIYYTHNGKPAQHILGIGLNFTI